MRPRRLNLKWNVGTRLIIFLEMAELALSLIDHYYSDFFSCFSPCIKGAIVRRARAFDDIFPPLARTLPSERMLVKL